MKKELEKMIETLPTEVPWNQIVDFDNLDERVSAISCLFVNTIGVCEKYIEFCPDNEPPLKEEVLSWIWTFRPDLADELLNLKLSESFEKLIICYKSDKMNSFWDYIS